MPNTYTELISDGSVPAAGGLTLFKRRLVLQLTTANYLVETFILNLGPTQNKLDLKVRTYFTTSNLDQPTTEDYQHIFGLSAKYFETCVKRTINPAFSPSVNSTPPFMPVGPYLFVWVDVPPNDGGLSLYTYVSEIPN